jgi:hypothetical protein
MKMDPAFNDEFVIVRRGKHEGDPSEITVNCPDKVGLGCDFARTVFEFGLSVVKGGEFSHSFFMDEIFYGDLFTKSCHLWKIYKFCGGNGIIECHVLVHFFMPWFWSHPSFLSSSRASISSRELLLLLLHYWFVTFFQGLLVGCRFIHRWAMVLCGAMGGPKS